MVEVEKETSNGLIKVIAAKNHKSSQKSVRIRREKPFVSCDFCVSLWLQFFLKRSFLDNAMHAWECRETPMKSNTGGQRRGIGEGTRGFSLTEMIVTVGVIIALAALLMPGIRRMQLQAKQTQCISNLRAIGSGFQRFLGENNNRYPGNGPSGDKRLRWMYRVGPYMDLNGPIIERTASNGEVVSVLDNAFSQAVFHCPMTNPSFYRAANAPLESVGVYGAQNVIILTEVPPGLPNPPTGPWGIHAMLISRPAKTVLLADRYAGGGNDTPSGMGSNLATSAPYPVNKPGAAANHREDRNPAADPLGAGPCNFLFCDGHVETIKLEKLRPFIDKPGCPVDITFKP